MKTFRSHHIFFLIISWIYLANTLESVNTNKTAAKTESLPPCQACKALVQSFQKGVERTARSKFEGGDADWEESRLGSYVRSEVRLVEIQEQLCSELLKGQVQCQSLAEAHESLLEEWWFKRQDDEPDLHTWLCINNLRVCCPDGHYGAQCSPCPGFPNICSGNGKCKGNGTRKGNGDCVCNEGYQGDLCTSCGPNFYTAYQDGDKVLCSRCHNACQDACSQAGPKGCAACKSGWFMDPELGCTDLNECLTNNPCKGNTFCVNSPGSYQCLQCDKACDGCDGDGPDFCQNCAQGFTLKDNVCVGTDDKQAQAKTTRYLTYLGLCVATCIILQSSLPLAAFVGFLVCCYISFSEYWMSSLDAKGVNGGLQLAGEDDA